MTAGDFCYQSMCEMGAFYDIGNIKRMDLTNYQRSPTITHFDYSYASCHVIPNYMAVAIYISRS